jgi:DNA processing protein
MNSSQVQPDTITGPDHERARLRAAIEITLVPGLGSLAQGRLRAACRDLSEAFSMDRSALGALEIQQDASEALLSRRYAPTAEEILDWGIKEGCQFLCRGGPNYPALLEHTFDPPLILYARGNLRALERPCIAVVGTRRPTYYGIQMAEGLAADLAQRGIAIVSGMARGIDAAAHRGCLESKGCTIAVFGCGVDVIYPREHRQLAREILKEGAILSEFPPGTSPLPQNFPVRNRIISGIAIGTLIVEASEYSGSLITARLAMEQNRELFALPGNITSPQSFGPNYLIKQGAKLVQTWRDIVEELPPELRHSILAKEDSQPSRSPELDFLSEEEKTILELISFDHATQFDKIYTRSGMEISRLASLLLNLEMRGWIRQVPGNLYVRASRPKR